MNKKSFAALSVCAGLAFFSGCGDDSSGKGASADERLEIVPISDKSISGVSQKGPFVTGSSVTLQELDGETLSQTGKSFKGKISRDDGRFGMSSVNLSSQYALLEAVGYYRNEVSGEKSIGTMTLIALTDLSDREKVNINLLTHLEYDRALHLIGMGMNVPAAKKQAELEIFNAFGIAGDFANSEDLSIFENGDGNAALLAFSVLLLGDLTEADLTERLTKFAMDIENDGSWDDAATKAAIADWANSKEMDGELSAIRSNVEGWNLGDVPEFEKYVRNFWWQNYGLGGCTADREGEVAADSNALSSNYYANSKVRYTCESGAWRKATDLEKNTYGHVCTTAEVGTVIRGEVNDEYYICAANLESCGWQEATAVEVDARGWVAGSDGDLKMGDSTTAIYKYDEALDEWVAAAEKDKTLGLKGCTTNREGEVGLSSTDGFHYMCKAGYWTQVGGEAFETWIGSDSVYRVETGFDDGTDSYGYWYAYNDANDGGTSTIVFPKEQGSNYFTDAMDPIIDYCGGVCGVATMGDGYQYPYVVIGFDIGGGQMNGYDISAWRGVCLTYKSDGIAPALEIVPEDEMTGYNNYKASLKIAASETTVNLAWSDFKQESGWGVKVEQSKVLAKAAAIRFRISTMAGKSTNFNITRIGQYGRCDE